MVAATALSPQTERTAAVLYGSETGNAQSIAEELGDLLERLRFETAVAELNYMSLVYTSRDQSFQSVILRSRIERLNIIYSCHYCNLNYWTR